MALRLFFCILLAVIPLSVILVGAEFTAIKNIAIIISAPFLIILAGTMIGLLKWLQHDDRIGLHAKIIAQQEEEMRAEALAEEQDLIPVSEAAGELETVTAE